MLPDSVEVIPEEMGFLGNKLTKQGHNYSQFHLFIFLSIPHTSAEGVETCLRINFVAIFGNLIKSGQLWGEHVRGGFIKVSHMSVLDIVLWVPAHDV